MLLSKPKRRKTHLENCQFQSEWMDKYLFVLPAVTSNKQVFLLCSECIYVMKEYNVKRHCKSIHGSFSASFPEGLEERRRKLQRLLASFQQCQVTLGLLLHRTREGYIASLHVDWTLTRQRRPFIKAETVKDCMLAVIDEVVVDEKVKESVFAQWNYLQRMSQGSF